MNVRRTVLATGLCLSLLSAGCASAVAGQAQIASGAALPTTSQSAPAPFPDPGSSQSANESSDTGSPSTGSSSTGSSSTDAPSTDAPSTEPSGSSTSDAPPTAITENTPTGPTSSDSSDGPSSVTSIPGLSKDCSAVLAGITAFSTVLQGGASETISQATVDTALEQLPESGLPARPQADMTVLRQAVSGAAGKTLSEVGLSMIDGKVVNALKDLSSWAQDNCG